MGVQLRAGERLVVLGLPWSGKTTWIQSSLAGIRSCVVIDSKQHPNEWPPWAAVNGYVVTRDWRDILRFPKVVYQVDQAVLEDREGWKKPGRLGYVWTQALNAILQRGNTVVVFDEGLQTLPVQQPHPVARRILTQGRAFRLTVIVGSQAPKWIDTFCIRLAEWCISFKVMAADTAAKIAEERGIPSDELLTLNGPGPGENDHQWAAHRIGTPSWVRHAKVDKRRVAAISRVRAPRGRNQKNGGNAAVFPSQGAA
jgi:hypothetical protein